MQRSRSILVPMALRLWISYCTDTMDPSAALLVSSDFVPILNALLFILVLKDVRTCLRIAGNMVPKSIVQCAAQIFRTSVAQKPAPDAKVADADVRGLLFTCATSRSFWFAYVCATYLDRCLGEQH